MPEELVIDYGHPSHQAIRRQMSDEDAAQLAEHQAASQARLQADDTHRQEIHSALTAYLTNPAPTPQETASVVKELVRVLIRDLP